MRMSQSRPHHHPTVLAAHSIHSGPQRSLVRAKTISCLRQFAPPLVLAQHSILRINYSVLLGLDVRR